MFANRMFYVMIVLALVLVIVLAFQQAISAGAIGQAGRAYYPAVQAGSSACCAHRGGMNPGLLLNKHVLPAYRGGFNPKALLNIQAIASYDAIENLRVWRGAKR